MVLPTGEIDRNVFRETPQIVVTKYGQVIPVVLHPIHREAMLFSPTRTESTENSRSLNTRMCTVISDVGTYMSYCFRQVIRSVAETYTDDQFAALNHASVNYPYGTY